MPAGLIGTSIGQVFISKASGLYREGKLASIVNSISNKLIIYGLCISIPACFVLSPIIPLVFGVKWGETSKLLPLMIPLFIGQLSVSSISPAFSQSMNNKNGLIAQISLTTLRLLPLIIILKNITLSFFETVLTYSLFSFMGYLIFGIILRLTLSNKKTNNL